MPRLTATAVMIDKKYRWRWAYTRRRPIVEDDAMVWPPWLFAFTRFGIYCFVYLPVGTVQISRARPLPCVSEATADETEAHEEHRQAFQHLCRKVSR
jgi:hypothetical protein